MTPADGSGFAHDASPVAVGRTQAILLHGGRAILLFEAAATPPPRSGHVIEGDGTAPWAAESWCAGTDGGHWCGLAVLDALPQGETRIQDACGREWRLAAPARIDIAAQPLADLVRGTGADSRAVFGFLIRRLLAGRPSDAPEAQAHRSFARSFLTAAAERDGFIEILAAPEGGGLLAQGWSISLGPGATTLARVADDLALREAEVAVFAREDVLPPARGCCLFEKSWRDEDLTAVEAVFFEKDGRLLRLDVVRDAVLRRGDEAAAHVAEMLPRLCAPSATLAAFRRICRPRFSGADTLSAACAPVAAALDAVLQAPDGAILATGWLLDLQHRVARVLIKSSANLYAPLNASWCPLPRPDLNRGFAADPRFADLLDPHDVMHGFIVQVQARREQVDGAQIYLEIVLDDDSCLFQPISVTPFDSAERLPQVLAALSPGAPELARIVTEHLAPFLASVRPTARVPRRGAATRPIPLGDRPAAAEVAAIMPVRRFAELQPVLALLAGAPEAAMLDLTLVAGRDAAGGMLEALRDAFPFYGLGGSLVIAAERETVAGRLDAGLAASGGRRVLCWMPTVLPKRPGWLAALIAEADALAQPGLLSPALTYEDGSIYFGGDGASSRAAAGVAAMAGYGGGRLKRGAPQPVAAGAAEIALIDRELLLRAGGFAGQLFSDAFSHLDLAARLRDAGAAAHCSGGVAFWMLDDPCPGDASPFARLMERVDAALIARRSLPPPGACTT